MCLVFNLLLYKVDNFIHLKTFQNKADSMSASTILFNSFRLKLKGYFLVKFTVYIIHYDFFQS